MPTAGDPEGNYDPQPGLVGRVPDYLVRKTADPPLPEPERKEGLPRAGRCAQCKQETEADDIAVAFSERSPYAGYCLACYRRITETEQPMPDRLRQEIAPAVNHVQN